jgi:hypothetical protein
MKKIISLACAAILACLVSAGADAKVGDSQWAACVWQTDSEAADNWLKLAAPKWQDEAESPSEMLGLRLIAKCDATPADTAKPNRIPNWKSMRQQLLKARPKGQLTSQPATVQARLCNHYAVKNSNKALYLSEAVRVQNDTETTVYQAYFDQAGTGALKVVDYAGRQVSFQFSGIPDSSSPVRLPQVTMIASPSEGYTPEKVCRTIESDGSLTNA